MAKDWEKAKEELGLVGSLFSDIGKNIGQIIVNGSKEIGNAGKRVVDTVKKDGFVKPAQKAGRAINVLRILLG